jgi:hypothetical protein
MDICIVPVSIGELYDKYSILEIKKDHIKDNDKLISINKEIFYLQPFIDRYNLSDELRKEMKSINLCLWNIEDAIREKEKRQEFDDDFIQLARSVYIKNDQRSIIKNKINTYLSSEIKDIKSYV